MLVRAVGYLAWVFFAVSLLLLVYTVVTHKNRPRPEGTDDVSMPALAMEFVDTDAKLHRIIGKPDARDGETARLRKKLKAGLSLDYGFIVGYWLLFAGIAGVLAQRGGGAWAKWVALAAVLTATGAAAADVVENLRMSRVIDAVSLTGGDVASAGFLKWLFSFVTLALLSFTFFGRGEWFWAVGLVCLLVAGLGFAGLAFIRSGVQVLWPVVAAFLLMLFGLLPLVAYAFTVRGDAFPPR